MPSNAVIPNEMVCVRKEQDSDVWYIEQANHVERDPRTDMIVVVGLEAMKQLISSLSGFAETAERLQC